MYQDMLNDQTALNDAKCYMSSWEHLQDELKRIKLLLCFRYIKLENKSSAIESEKYKGHAIVKEEIEELLFEDEDLELDEGLNDLKQEIFALETEIEYRRRLSIENGVFLSLQHLTDVFSLTRFEEQCILFCLAVELDQRYRKIYAYLQDDMTRINPTPDFIMDLLNLPRKDRAVARESFNSTSPLIKYCMHMQETNRYTHIALISRELFCDDRIIDFLLELDQMDESLANLVNRIIPTAADTKQLIMDEELEKRICSFLKSGFPRIQEEGKKVIFNFYGPRGAGKKSLAEYICCHLKAPMLVVDMKKLAESQLPFKESAWKIGREIILQGAALCIENFDCLYQENDFQGDKMWIFLEMLKEASEVTFVLGCSPWRSFDEEEEFVFLDMKLDIPDERRRMEYWELYRRKSKIGNLINSDGAAGKFCLTPGQIKNAVSMAENLLLWNPQDSEKGIETLTYKACHRQSDNKLSTIARKIKPCYTWDDIILNEYQKSLLTDVCGQVKYRYVVFGEWGFDKKLSYGKGLSILFYGPPGTGKTMAAEVIANELGLELYKIDLSQVISKYIGETEKNLQQIFNEAQTSNAILFFDEADALFGKRSEVRDAHDRYANIEVAYLLQKMEEYDGITILATNLNNNLDTAFSRRLSFSIEFPFPDEKYRERIWRSVFPKAVPVSEDVDFGLIAKGIQLAGGNIRNIALSAAFLAAGEGQAVGMAHIIEAAKREYRKASKIWNEFDR